ncbi:MAG TPA: hypothetical protein VJ978_03535 [Nitriliruptoraceae bacterium]|nr:hypothetical protein [Nitriliruptoraceae bacterium]
MPAGPHTPEDEATAARHGDAGDDGADRGVVFPLSRGRRSTSALGQAVVAAALAEVDPTGADAARRATAWRSDYLQHHRRLVEAGVAQPQDWLTIASDGLDATHDLMHFVPTDASSDSSAVHDGRADQVRREISLRDAVDLPATASLHTQEVQGTGEPEGFVLPWRGEQLEGDGIRRRVDAWITAGIMEPSVATAIDDVIAHPEWLQLDGWTMVVCGAGAEMAPLGTLLRWGATVAAVDLPRPELWQRILESASTTAGRLLVPVPDHADDAQGDARSEDGSTEHHDGALAALASRAGIDLVQDPMAVADWILGLPGNVAIGNYAYADGGAHVRVSAAVDLVIRRVQARRPDLALAFLATPTDVFVAPRDAVRQSTAAYEARSTTARVLGRPLRAISRGRLLQRNHAADADPGIADSLVPAQGPNYALAKRLQRWRAAVARAEGTRVSFHVAPSSRTHSVTKNRVLAAAFAGAHRFGVEVFDPTTANTLMAALLVRDLHVEPESHDHPWQDEAHEAVHGGLWRSAWAPRSALGLAAVLGYASARS